MEATACIAEFGRTHRHPAHALDARRDDDVLGARHHRLRRELDRLLRGAALAVDRDGGYAVRQAGGENRITADVVRLLPGLGDAAHDNVLNRGRIDAAALRDRIERYLALLS